MTVGLAEIEADGDVPAVSVSAANYDAPDLIIEQEDAYIVLTRKQLQPLWLAIERFQDQ